MADEGSPQHPPRIRIIGVGNTYRGDDAVGLIVARRLQEEPLDHVTIREASGDGSALLELWQDAEAVILIDAVQSGVEPGTVHRFDARVQPIPAAFFRYSTHAFGVAEAIELARALQQLPPCLVVYGIEGKNFAAGIGLSLAVEQIVGEVVGQVQQEIAAWSATSGG